MSKEKTLKKIGYCGLVCMLCSGCESCRDKDKGVALDGIECFHKRCAIEKNLDGCWECNEFPCDGNMFKSIRVRAFVGFIRDEGIDAIIECLTENQKKDIKYGCRNDYDLVATEEEVVELLNRGRKNSNS